MKQIMFSIVVPVYNVEAYLSECLDSVLAQTDSDYELLVVDDKSKDSSLAIAREYAHAHPDHIHLLEHTVNKGLGGARNTGIEAAKGQYLLFLDSDDYLRADTLATLRSVIEEKNPDVVEFCFARVDENGADLGRDYCIPGISTPDGRERSLLTRTVPACNKAIRTKLFQKSHIRFPEKRYYEDYWTIPKLWMTGCTVCSLDEALYFYRQRTGSIMHDTNIEKANDVLAGADNLLDYCRQCGFPEDRWQELEYMIIRNLLATAVRVNGINPRSAMQDTIWEYWMTHFPNYPENPYWDLLDSLHKRLLRLVTQKKYIALYITFHIRARVVRIIKKCLCRQ